MEAQPSLTITQNISPILRYMTMSDVSLSPGDLVEVFQIRDGVKESNGCYLVQCSHFTSLI